MLALTDRAIEIRSLTFVIGICNINAHGEIGNDWFVKGRDHPGRNQGRLRKTEVYLQIERPVRQHRHVIKLSWI